MDGKENIQDEKYHAAQSLVSVCTAPPRDTVQHVYHMDGIIYICDVYGYITARYSIITLITYGNLNNLQL